MQKKGYKRVYVNNKGKEELLYLTPDLMHDGTYDLIKEDIVREEDIDFPTFLQGSLDFVVSEMLNSVIPDLEKSVRESSMMAFYHIKVCKSGIGAIKEAIKTAKENNIELVISDDVKKVLNYDFIAFAKSLGL